MLRLIAQLAMFLSAVSAVFGLGLNNWEGRKLSLATDQLKAAPPAAHLPLPQFVRGIYLTAATAASARFEELVALAKEKGLNTLVIDLKDADGRLAFAPQDEQLRSYGTHHRLINDLESVAHRLHREDIYFVGRITIFQDPALAASKPELALKTAQGNVWSDFKGVKWVDPASKEVWDYNLRIAKEAASLGVDEINLDYVRFPSDGTLRGIKYPFWDGKEPKAQVISSFFDFFDKGLAGSGAKLSIDLFGLTTWKTDDLNIGQKLEDAAPHFDAIAPMVYPSHFPAGFQGKKNPAEYPYEIIFESVKRGRARLGDASRASIRPWLQDFNLGATYDRVKVRREIEAAEAAGASGWLLWNARNVYTKEAL